jgi:hypothetical protein
MGSMGFIGFIGSISRLHLVCIIYLTDPAYAGRFDPNPMHAPRAAE